MQRLRLPRSKYVHSQVARMSARGTLVAKGQKHQGPHHKPLLARMAQDNIEQCKLIEHLQVALNSMDSTI